MAALYAPKRGEVVWLTFTPQAGHEQAGRRPAVVLSPEAYNRKVGLALVCPITSHIKGYPFEVLLPSDLPVTGVALADQVKSLDWKARQATFCATLPGAVIHEISNKLGVLIEE